MQAMLTHPYGTHVEIYHTTHPATLVMKPLDLFEALEAGLLHLIDAGPHFTVKTHVVVDHRSLRYPTLPNAQLAKQNKTSTSFSHKDINYNHHAYNTSTISK